MVLLGAAGARADGPALLARACGLDALPEQARASGGKPWFPGLPGLHFNLSHSGGLLLCGAGTAEVGVDIERVRPRGAGLPRYALSDGEYAWFRGRGGRWADFYTLWTLKEARCKWDGRGLRAPPREIAVPLLEPGEAGALDGLCLRAYGGADWRAAACAAAGTDLPPEIAWRTPV